jgi:hypothetical protein
MGELTPRAGPNFRSGSRARPGASQSLAGRGHALPAADLRNGSPTLSGWTSPFRGGQLRARYSSPELVTAG